MKKCVEVKGAGQFQVLNELELFINGQILRLGVINIYKVYCIDSVI